MNIIFSRDLRLATLGFLEQLTVTGGFMGSFDGVDSATKRILISLLRENVISRKDVEDAVHKALVAAGKRALLQCARGDWPDHVISPQALAYVIELKLLSPKEIVSIKFDHNETAESFPALYNPRGAGLCADIAEQLLSERKISFTESILG